MPGKMTKQFNQAKHYLSIIMPSICSTLEENGIPYAINEKGTEVRVKTPEHTRQTLTQTIMDQTEIPSICLITLAEITECDGVIYIRKRMQ